MLQVIIPKKEYLDERTNKVIEMKETTLALEHSLISVSKWEQKWKKSFLWSKDKSDEELIDYIKCMTINKVDDEKIYNHIPSSLMLRIVKYIKDPMTATTFSDNKIGASKSQKEIITSETIYYWMIKLGVPVEFEKWHLGRLLALIKLISIKEALPDKMDKKAAAAERVRENKKRRQKYNTKG